MREHGLLFSGPMVRALLEGRKTMTRRAVTERNSVVDWSSGRNEGVGWADLDLERMEEQMVPEKLTGRRWREIRARIEVGDRVWVREAFALPEVMDNMPPRLAPVGSLVWYKGDSGKKWPGCGKWRPGIFLPRWACRMTLTVREVWCERLHEIDENDACLEGAKVMRLADGTWSYREGFRTVWDAINGGGEMAWEKNPLVWGYRFDLVRG
jgi:hypothetical protein